MGGQWGCDRVDRMPHTNIWRSHPSVGMGSRCCRICSNHHALIRKYGLMICRQCFRENANAIGFKKYR
eukprot:NODE_2700_length_554_cov_614.102970_g2319_i0.p2 GENE.NODE_2700_length_554_cov_614.102970_g2319_i0~~NODE_2700_length_554_cov_614.102970_g2319_i0.p2  ORF type:complete len:78 (+),score=20.02 NODE_2700_length_554_cov_614.102970_g2319_i0:32-235(+)